MRSSDLEIGDHDEPSTTRSWVRCKQITEEVAWNRAALQLARSVDGGAGGLPFGQSRPGSSCTLV